MFSSDEEPYGNILQIILSVAFLSVKPWKLIRMLLFPDVKDRFIIAASPVTGAAKWRKVPFGDDCIYRKIKAGDFSIFLSLPSFAPRSII
jgi:hypothetical protein